MSYNTYATQVSVSHDLYNIDGSSIYHKNWIKFYRKAVEDSGSLSLSDRPYADPHVCWVQGCGKKATLGSHVQMGADGSNWYLAPCCSSHNGIGYHSECRAGEILVRADPSTWTSVKAKLNQWFS